MNCQPSTKRKRVVKNVILNAICGHDPRLYCELRDLIVRAKLFAIWSQQEIDWVSLLPQQIRRRVFSHIDIVIILLSLRHGPVQAQSHRGLNRRAIQRGLGQESRP